MLRRQKQIRAQFLKVVDAAIFGFSFWVAHLLRAKSAVVLPGAETAGSSAEYDLPWLLRFLFRQPGTHGIEPFAEYAWLLVIIVPLSPLLLELQGFYNRPLLASRKRTAWQVAKGCALTLMVVISVMFLRKEMLARAVIILFPTISFALVMLKEELIRRWMESKAGQAQMKKRLILAGTAEDTDRLRDYFSGGKREGLEVVARLDLNQTTLDELIDLLHKTSANGVVLAGRHTYFGQIEKAIQACELEGVEVWLMADFFNTHLSQTFIDEIYGRPVLVFRSTPGEGWQAIGKQMFDLAAAAVLLVGLLPLLGAVALTIRLTSPGPVLFRQQRSGLNGRPFTMLKFRSMVSDAEQRKQELAELNEMDGPVFKLSEDPRVTPIGRFLRRYSIDELPQLINVMRGEMSLVGPRPLPVDETMRFDDFSHRRRLSVKPGLTCLWQISGRNNVCDFKDWVRLDLEYIDNWSLWLDFKILFRTIPVVLAGTGAK
jgi:exopolysaccharide biosynthesis polyprenyl glycosylphosphotransferase